MGRLDNLKPFNTLTPERRHELAVKGGKARAAQRRAQRAEIDRLKAEEIARQELKRESVWALLKGANMLHAAAMIYREEKRG